MDNIKPTFMIPIEDKVRYKYIFDTIDVEKKGRISFCDLCVSLEDIYKGETGHPLSSEYFLSHAGADQDNMMTFKEFVLMMYSLEKDLEVIFMEIDLNHDGQLDIEEVQKFFQKNNITLNREKVAEIIRSIVVESSDTISLDQWKEFNQNKFLNSGDNLIKYWIDYMQDVSVLSIKAYSVYSSLPWWKLLIAGATAGFLSRTLTAPLDRLRICYSVSEKNLAGVRLWDAVRRMIRAEGFLSLWKGNGTSLVKMIPDTAMRFLVYELLKTKAKELKGTDEKQTRLTNMQTFAVGILSSSITTTVLYPLEVVKVRLALSETKQYSGIFDCLQQVYRHEGIRSFFRGYVPTVCGYVPYAALDISIFEFLKRMHRNHLPEKKRLGVLSNLTSGIVSSIISVSVFYPITLVRTEMQARTSAIRENKFMATAKKVFKSEGVLGFYKGLLPCVLRVAPAVSLSYVIYEETKMILHSV